MGRRNGRPSKLTPDVQDTICQHIELGQFQHIAAALAGISDETFWRWMRQGEDVVEEGTGRVLQVAPKRFRLFRAAVLQARTKCEAAMVVNVRLAAQNGDWKAAAFWLERVFPERWGRRTRLEHVGEGGGPVKAEVAVDFDRLFSELSSDERAVVRTILERRALQSGPSA
jgi:hypothetical protein